MPFALAIAVVALAVLPHVGSAAAQADRFALAIELVKSSFPQLRTQESLLMSAIVDGTYEPTRILAVNVFVEPSATMQKARATRTASELHQLLLHAIIHFDDERQIESAHFHGRTVSGLDNERFGKEVGQNERWDRAAVLEQLRARGAQCATKDAARIALPLAGWEPIFGPLTVRTLEFDDPAARATPGTFSRADAYRWQAVLVSSSSRGGIYTIALEPFGCAVTDLNKY